MADLNNPAILTPIIAVLCQNFCNLKLMRVNKTWYNLIRQELINRGSNTQNMLKTVIQILLNDKTIDNSLLKAITPDDLCLYAGIYEFTQVVIDFDNFGFNYVLPNGTYHGMCLHDTRDLNKLSVNIYIFGKLLYKP